MLNQDLLARFIDQIPFQPDDRVLLFFSEPEAIITTIAAQVDSVTIIEGDFALWRQLQQNPRKPANVNGMDITTDDDSGSFTQALIVSPKGRGFARAQLWRAYRGLQPDGQVYMIGANNKGIKSVITDAEALYSQVRVLAYKKGHRIGAGTKTGLHQPFPPAWGDDPTRLQQKSFDTPLGMLEIATAPGIFSWLELDAGTEFLLTQSYLQQIAVGATILDVGCGTGVIGSALAPVAETVHMVDSNLLAVQAARMTAQLNHLTNVRVYPSDVYSEVTARQFDLIVSNPPFHKGFDVSKAVAERILQEAKTYLRSGGQLIIVANVFLPYEELMRSYFKAIEVVASNKSFKVVAGKIPGS